MSVARLAKKRTSTPRAERAKLQTLRRTGNVTKKKLYLSGKVMPLFVKVSHTYSQHVYVPLFLFSSSPRSLVPSFSSLGNLFSPGERRSEMAAIERSVKERISFAFSSDNQSSKSTTTAIPGGRSGSSGRSGGSSGSSGGGGKGGGKTIGGGESKHVDGGACLVEATEEQLRLRRMVRNVAKSVHDLRTRNRELGRLYVENRRGRC